MNTYSGVDCKIFTDYGDTTAIQDFTAGERKQGLHGENLIGGDVSFIGLDSLEHLKWLNKKCHLTATAKTSTGQAYTIYDAYIRFDANERIKISINNIVGEVILGYTLIERRFPKSEES